MVLISTLQGLKESSKTSVKTEEDASRKVPDRLTVGPRAGINVPILNIEGVQRRTILSAKMACCISSEVCADLQISSCYLMLLTYEKKSWGRLQHCGFRSRSLGREKEEWQENERAGAGERLGCSLRRRGKRGGGADIQCEVTAYVHVLMIGAPPTTRASVCEESRREEARRLIALAAACRRFSGGQRRETTVAHLHFPAFRTHHHRDLLRCSLYMKLRSAL